jgi:hypothetical protein
MSEAAQPGTAQQVCGLDDQGRWILAVIAKRTYIFVPQGQCVLARQQLPLVRAPEFADPEQRLLSADIDLWPFKQRTDVIISGHAYNHRRTPSFGAAVRVNQAVKQVAVFGDRRCTLTPSDKIVWSAPTTVERVPLTYALAYGGKDAQADRIHGNPAELLAPYLGAEVSSDMIADASPYIYPRNPVGRGYVVEKSREAIDGLALPNFEDPQNLLTPERLVVGAAGRWPAQPLPAGFGYMDYGMFPRIAWLGQIPDFDASLDPRVFGEIARGHANASILKEDQQGMGTPSLESANGAPLGLRLPYLKGNDEIELLNLSPHYEKTSFRLPRERPKLWVDNRDGTLLPVEPIIHSVLIAPDENRVAIVWRGSAPARRSYLNEEMPKMPFAAEW